METQTPDSANPLRDILSKELQAKKATLTEIIEKFEKQITNWEVVWEKLGYDT